MRHSPLSRSRRISVRGELSLGSLLFSVVRNGAYVHVAMGSLVDAPSIRPTEHIFVGSKAPWFDITDNLPQFEEYAT
jgi:hypothetical protein